MILILIYCYLLCIHYSYCLIIIQAERTEIMIFQNGWSCIFQIIFWNVLINWFINCVGFTAAYTSNGRQRTAEEDLQEFLNKSPTASRPNEADRLSSHLLRWFLGVILLLYTWLIFKGLMLTEFRVIYIQKTKFWFTIWPNSFKQW